MRKRISLSIGVLLLILPTAALARVPQLSLAGALSSLDGDYTVPAAWAGIWTEQVTGYDCDTQFQFYSESYTDTICTGDPVALSDDPESNVVCSGTITDTAINVECSWSGEITAGCTASFTMTMQGTRTGDSYEATSTLNISYVGETCEFVGDTCIREVSTGTRIGPEPPECASPVETATWGGIKALYR